MNDKWVPPSFCLQFCDFRRKEGRRKKKSFFFSSKLESHHFEEISCCTRTCDDEVLHPMYVRNVIVERLSSRIGWVVFTPKKYFVLVRSNPLES